MKCNICLNFIETTKCYMCTFNSCKPCITEWVSQNNSCPQCKCPKTYDIKNKNANEKIYVPLFDKFPPEILESDILEEWRMFTTDSFVENFNKLPERIKKSWNYCPLIMNIDGTEEIISYILLKL
jgi:hypothetical protein